MTRDELPNAIIKALIEKFGHYDGEADVILPLIDQYAATERHEIEQQITSHVETRLASERERIAQAMPEAVAGRVTWGDEEFISVADVDRIIREGGAQ